MPQPAGGGGWALARIAARMRTAPQRATGRLAQTGKGIKEINSATREDVLKLRRVRLRLTPGRKQRPKGWLTHTSATNTSGKKMQPRDERGLRTSARIAPTCNSLELHFSLFFTSSLLYNSRFSKNINPLSFHHNLLTHLKNPHLPSATHALPINHTLK